MRTIRIVVLVAIFCSASTLLGQGVAVEQIWHSTANSSITVNIKVSKSSVAATVPLTFQRYNEFDLKLGDEQSRNISLAAGEVTSYKFDESELKGAAYLTYSVALPTGLTVPQRADLRDAKSALAELERLQDELAQAQSDLIAAKAARRSDAVKKQADIKALQDQLLTFDQNTVDHFLPTSIVLDRAPEVFDDHVGFYVRTNKPGLVEVIARQDSDEGVVITSKKSDTLATEHLIAINQQLAPDSWYRFEVQVLNFDGSPRPNPTKITLKQEPLLRLKLAPRLIAPRPEVRAIELTSSALTVPVSVDRDSVVSVQLAVKTGQRWVAVDTRGSAPAITKTDFGRPTNPSHEYQRAGDLKSYTFDNLDSEKEYKVDVVAAAIDGANETWTSEGHQTLRTLPRLPELQFKDGLTVEFSATEVKLSWEANIEPDAASVTVVTPGVDLKFGAPVVVKNGTKLTATLKAPALPAIASFSAEPSLIATMSKKNSKDATMTVRVALRLPDAASVAALTDNATKSAVTDLTKVVQQKGTSKRFDWNALIRTGLGLVLAGL